MEKEEKMEKENIEKKISVENAAVETINETITETVNEADTLDADAPTEDAFAITKRFKQPAAREKARQTQQTQQAPVRKSNLVGVTDKKAETKRILIFLALCFGMAWFLEIFNIIPMYQSNDEELIKQASDLLTQVMLAPALAAIAARLFTREGLVKSGFQFNFSEHKFLFLAGWFGMTALTFAGAVLYFIIFRDNFDPDMTNFIATYTANASAETEIDAVDVVAAYKTDLLIKVFTAAMLDIMSSFGHEWGFRAYLLPKLFRKIGAVPAMLVSGLASGLWYAPLVAIGNFYGSGNAGFPVVNIIAMCLFGMVTGVIYSFLCLRTGSIFPSVFAHSALNVMMSQAALFTFDGGNYFVGPSPTGILSGLPMAAAAVFCLVHVHKHPIKAGTEQAE